MTEICPTCGGALRPGNSDRRKVLACVPCGYLRDVDMRPVKAKLPGLDPGRQSVYEHENEKKMVTQARNALMLLGFIVYRIGQWRANYAGTDEATPDLLITYPGLGNNWHTQEFKIHTGKLRPTQELLVNTGATDIIRSVEESISDAQAWLKQRENEIGKQTNAGAHGALRRTEDMSSEGNCPECGYPLGIEGRCTVCALEKKGFSLRGGTYPKCRECGGSVVHSRLHGYHCAANHEHTGIVWPGREN